MLWVTNLESISPMSSGCFGWVWIQQRVRVCQVCTSHLDWTLLTDTWLMWRTSVQVWERGGAAARAWQHDWRDGSWQQAHQGPVPEIETFIMKFIFVTFLVIHDPLVESPSRPSLWMDSCYNEHCFSFKNEHCSCKLVEKSLDKVVSVVWKLHFFPSGVHGQPKESRRKWLVIKLGFSILITNGKKCIYLRWWSVPSISYLGRGMISIWFTQSCIFTGHSKLEHHC